MSDSTTLFLLCSTPPKPHHWKDLGHLLQLEHRFQMISWQQVYLNTAGDPYVCPPIPPCHFQFISRHDCIQPRTSLLIKGAGISKAPTTAAPPWVEEICADRSSGDSANSPWCAFMLNWPPLWHPLEHYTKHFFTLVLKLKNLQAFPVYRFMIIATAVRYDERINTAPSIALGRGFMIA